MDLEDSLPGTWKVDLRQTPDAAPYYKALVLISRGFLAYRSAIKQ
jgi:hypothetical protein